MDEKLKVVLNFHKNNKCRIIWVTDRFYESVYGFFILDFCTELRGLQRNINRSTIFLRNGFKNEGNSVAIE